MAFFLYEKQYKTKPSGVTGGGGGRGAEWPLRLLTGIFYLPGKKEASKKWKRGKWRRKEGKLYKGRWKIENGRRETFQNEERAFFVHFSNDSNLFWVYQIGNFLPGKSISRRETNQEKWLCPLRKNFLLRPCTPSTITVDGEVYTSNEDIAHAFNKHFSSVATKLIDTQCCNDFDNDVVDHDASINDSAEPEFELPAISVDFVCKEIDLMSEKKATGLDDVGCKLLKIAKPAIVNSLTYIMNLSLKTGVSLIPGSRQR